MDRLRFITNCLTRLRYCDAEGGLALQEKSPPGRQPEHLVPWFAMPNRGTRDDRIIFGHWSSLGYFAAHNVWALDTGCIWGGHMTAIRVHAKNAIVPESVDCAEQYPNL
jgi:bis(5'-nucleosyl)-tetraphosphatase (symmetrical)